MYCKCSRSGCYSEIKRSFRQFVAKKNKIGSGQNTDYEAVHRQARGSSEGRGRRLKRPRRKADENIESFQPGVVVTSSEMTDD